MKNFRECAEHYLHQWYEQDHFFHYHFSRGHITCELLADVCSKYQVNRTIPRKDGITGAVRLQPFAGMLCSYARRRISEKNVVHEVNDALGRMKKAYGKSFLSAITKALWMVKRDPVVIYDSLARAGLRHYKLDPGDSDYEVYVDSWREFRDSSNTKDQLDEAVRWLADSPCARCLMERKRISRQNFRNIVDSRWFRARTIDMYLLFVTREKPARSAVAAA